MILIEQSGFSIRLHFFSRSYSPKHFQVDDPVKQLTVTHCCHIFLVVFLDESHILYSLRWSVIVKQSPWEFWALAMKHQKR